MGAGSVSPVPYPHPRVWAGLVTCFDQWNRVEVTWDSHSLVRKLEVFCLDPLGRFWLPYKEVLLVYQNRRSQGGEEAWAVLVHSQTCEWGSLGPSSPVDSLSSVSPVKTCRGSAQPPQSKQIINYCCFGQLHFEVTRYTAKANQNTGSLLFSLQRKVYFIYHWPWIFVIKYYINAA